MFLLEKGMISELLIETKLLLIESHGTTKYKEKKK